MLSGQAIVDILRKPDDQGVLDFHGAVRGSGVLTALSAMSPITLSPAAVVDFLPPHAIFGRPERTDCLAGVEPREIQLPRRTLHRIGSAKVIGRTTVLTQDGHLIVPDDRLDLPESEYRHVLEQAVVRPRADGCAEAVYLKGGEGGVRLRGVSLYVPDIEPGNYGSFLIRVVPFLLLVSTLRLKIDIFVVPTTTPFMTEALRLLFPAGGYQVVDLRSTGNVIFDDLWTTQGGHPEGLLSPDLVELFDKLAFRAMLASKADISHDKLYISRRLTRHQKPKWRPLLNETEIVLALEERGFVETFLENYGFAEQIAAFNKARIVVGPSGSGNLNTIWTRSLYVCEMESFHTTVRQHAYVHASKGLDYSIVFGRADGSVDRRDAGALTRQPWKVNVADVLAAAELAETRVADLTDDRGACFE